ncbi:hypothetical protein HYZ05_00260 [Candidatus Daviesbacteria bacterium]|nr:hypothetical protein [Candidatus Daviesbacteria bacterium]
MIKHIWSVLCKESIINQDDNNLSIVNVLEALQVNLKPTNIQNKDQKLEAIVPINYEMVSFYTRDNKKEEEVKFEQELALINHKGEEINKDIKEIVIPAGTKRMRTRVKISGIKVQGSGDYIFQVSIKEEGQKLLKIVAEIPLEVTVTVEESSAR